MNTNLKTEGIDTVAHVMAIEKHRLQYLKAVGITRRPWGPFIYYRVALALGDASPDGPEGNVWELLERRELERAEAPHSGLPHSAPTPPMPEPGTIFHMPEGMDVRFRQSAFRSAPGATPTTFLSTLTFTHCANRDAGHWYVGSPYTKHPAGKDEAWRQVSQFTGCLLGGGLQAYSPVMHGHPTVPYLPGMGDVDWDNVNEPMMNGAFGLVVCMLDGWDESEGLEREIATFQLAGKPVVYVLPSLDGSVERRAAA